MELRSRDRGAKGIPGHLEGAPNALPVVAKVPLRLLFAAAGAHTGANTGTALALANIARTARTPAGSQDPQRHINGVV